MTRWLMIVAVLVAMVGGTLVPAAAGDTPPATGDGTTAAAPPPAPAKRSFAERAYFGGNVGFSFGDVDYIDISPYMGIDFGQNVSGGVGVFYRHREDNRYDPDLSTSDYGYSLFVRYRVVPQAFLQAEYDWTDFEYLLVDGSTERDSYSAVLLGGGFMQPMGGRSAFVVSVLYDLNWSNDELTPYDNPWLVSAGVSVGF